MRPKMLVKFGEEKLTVYVLGFIVVGVLVALGVSRSLSRGVVGVAEVAGATGLIM
jgi:hypothetical protein